MRDRVCVVKSQKVKKTLRYIADKLTGCFRDEFVPVGGTDREQTIAKVKVESRLRCHLTHDLRNETLQRHA